MIMCNYCNDGKITISAKKYAKRNINRHLFSCQRIYAYKCTVIDCRFYCVHPEIHRRLKHETKSGHVTKQVYTQQQAELLVKDKLLILQDKYNKTQLNQTKPVLANIVQSIASNNNPNNINHNILPNNNNLGINKFSNINYNTIIPAIYQQLFKHINSSDIIQLNNNYNDYKHIHHQPPQIDSTQQIQLLNQNNNTMNLENNIIKSSDILDSTIPTFKNIVCKPNDNNNRDVMKKDTVEKQELSVEQVIINNNNNVIPCQGSKRLHQYISQQQIKRKLFDKSVMNNSNNGIESVVNKRIKVEKSLKSNEQQHQPIESKNTIECSYELNCNKIGKGGQAYIFPLNKIQTKKTEYIIKLFHGSKQDPLLAQYNSRYLNQTIQSEYIAYWRMYLINEHKTNRYIRKLWSEKDISWNDLIKTQAVQLNNLKLQNTILNYLVYTKYDYTLESKFIHGKSDNKQLQSFTKNNKLTIMLQLCRALLFIHSCGIIHCDIKEGNIFVDLELKRCFIGDFGSMIMIPKAELLNEYNTEYSKLIYLERKNKDLKTCNDIFNCNNYHYYHGGMTHMYIPPELIYFNPNKRENKIEMKITQKSDIYSLGISLCHLFHIKPFPYNYSHTKDNLPSYDIKYNDKLSSPCLAMLTPNNNNSSNELNYSRSGGTEYFTLRAKELLEYIPGYKTRLTSQDNELLIIIKCLEGMLQANPNKRYTLSQCINIIEAGIK